MNTVKVSGEKGRVSSDSAFLFLKFRNSIWVYAFSTVWMYKQFIHRCISFIILIF